MTRRENEHSNDPETRPFVFKRLYETDIYAEQRGLEDVAYRLNPGARLNKIAPISARNLSRPEYEAAARIFLSKPNINADTGETLITQGLLRLE